MDDRQKPFKNHRSEGNGAFERFVISAIATIITLLFSWKILLDDESIGDGQSKQKDETNASNKQRSCSVANTEIKHSVTMVTNVFSACETEHGPESSPDTINPDCRNEKNMTLNCCSRPGYDHVTHSVSNGMNHAENKHNERKFSYDCETSTNISRDINDNSVVAETIKATEHNEETIDKQTRCNGENNNYSNFDLNITDDGSSLIKETPSIKSSTNTISWHFNGPYANHINYSSNNRSMCKCEANAVRGNILDPNYVKQGIFTTQSNIGSITVLGKTGVTEEGMEVEQCDTPDGTIYAINPDFKHNVSGGCVETSHLEDFLPGITEATKSSTGKPGCHKCNKLPISADLELSENHSSRHIVNDTRNTVIGGICDPVSLIPSICDRIPPDGYCVTNYSEDIGGRNKNTFSLGRLHVETLCGPGSACPGSDFVDMSKATVHSNKHLKMSTPSSKSSDMLAEGTATLPQEIDTLGQACCNITEAGRYRNATYAGRTYTFQDTNTNIDTDDNFEIKQNKSVPVGHDKLDVIAGNKQIISVLQMGDRSCMLSTSQDLPVSHNHNKSKEDSVDNISEINDVCVDFGASQSDKSSISNQSVTREIDQSKAKKCTYGKSVSHVDDINSDPSKINRSPDYVRDVNKDGNTAENDVVKENLTTKDTFCNHSNVNYASTGESNFVKVGKCQDLEPLRKSPVKASETHANIGQGEQFREGKPAERLSACAICPPVNHYCTQACMKCKSIPDCADANNDSHILSIGNKQRNGTTHAKVEFPLSQEILPESDNLKNDLTKFGRTKCSGSQSADVWDIFLQQKNSCGRFKGQSEVDLKVCNAKVLTTAGDNFLASSEWVGSKTTKCGNRCFDLAKHSTRQKPQAGKISAGFATVAQSSTLCGQKAADLNITNRSLESDHTVLDGKSGQNPYLKAEIFKQDKIGKNLILSENQEDIIQDNLPEDYSSRSGKIKDRFSQDNSVIFRDGNIDRGNIKDNLTRDPIGIDAEPPETQNNIQDNLNLNYCNDDSIKYSLPRDNSGDDDIRDNLTLDKFNKDNLIHTFDFTHKKCKTDYTDTKNIDNDHKYFNVIKVCKVDLKENTHKDDPSGSVTFTTRNRDDKNINPRAAIYCDAHTSSACEKRPNGFIFQNRHSVERVFTERYAIASERPTPLARKSATAGTDCVIVNQLQTALEVENKCRDISLQLNNDTNEAVLTNSCIRSSEPASLSGYITECGNHLINCAKCSGQVSTGAWDNSIACNIHTQNSGFPDIQNPKAALRKCAFLPGGKNFERNVDTTSASKPNTSITSTHCQLKSDVPTLHVAGRQAGNAGKNSFNVSRKLTYSPENSGEYAPDIKSSGCNLNPTEVKSESFEKTANCQTDKSAYAFQSKQPIPSAIGNVNYGDSFHSGNTIDCHSSSNSVAPSPSQKRPVEKEISHSPGISPSPIWFISDADTEPLTGKPRPGVTPAKPKHCFAGYQNTDNTIDSRKKDFTSYQISGNYKGLSDKSGLAVGGSNQALYRRDISDNQSNNGSLDLDISQEQQGPHTSILRNKANSVDTLHRDNILRVDGELKYQHGLKDKTNDKALGQNSNNVLKYDAQTTCKAIATSRALAKRDCNLSEGPLINTELTYSTVSAVASAEATGQNPYIAVARATARAATIASASAVREVSATQKSSEAKRHDINKDSEFESDIGLIVSTSCVVKSNDEAAIIRQSNEVLNSLEPDPHVCIDAISSPRYNLEGTSSVSFGAASDSCVERLGQPNLLHSGVKQDKCQKCNEIDGNECFHFPGFVNSTPISELKTLKNSNTCQQVKANTGPLITENINQSCGYKNSSIFPVAHSDNASVFTCQTYDISASNESPGVKNNTLHHGSKPLSNRSCDTGDKLGIKNSIDLRGNNRDEQLILHSKGDIIDVPVSSFKERKPLDIVESGCVSKSHITDSRQEKLNSNDQLSNTHDMTGYVNSGEIALGNKQTMEKTFDTQQHDQGAFSGQGLSVGFMTSPHMGSQTDNPTGFIYHPEPQCYEQNSRGKSKTLFAGENNSDVNVEVKQIKGILKKNDKSKDTKSKHSAKQQLSISTDCHKNSVAKNFHDKHRIQFQKTNTPIGKSRFAAKHELRDYTSALQAPIVDSRTPLNVLKKFALPEKPAPPCRVKNTEARKDFLASGHPVSISTQPPIYAFECRQKQDESKENSSSQKSDSVSKVMVVDIDIEGQNANGSTERKTVLEIKKQLRSARLKPPPAPSIDKVWNASEIIAKRTQEKQSHVRKDSYDACKGMRGRDIPACENGFHRTQSLTVLPKSFFADRTSYTSLMETDLDTGEHCEIPLVFETDLDDSNAIKFRSLSNLTEGEMNSGRYVDDLDRHKSMVALPVSKQKGGELLSSKKETNMVDMGKDERSRSEHELRVIESLNKLSVPWFLQSSRRSEEIVPLQNTRRRDYRSSFRSNNSYSASTSPNTQRSVDSTRPVVIQRYMTPPRRLRSPSPNPSVGSAREDNSNFELPSEKLRQRTSSLPRMPQRSLTDIYQNTRTDLQTKTPAREAYLKLKSGCPGQEKESDSGTSQNRNSDSNNAAFQNESFTTVSSFSFDDAENKEYLVSSSLSDSAFDNLEQDNPACSGEQFTPGMDGQPPTKPFKSEFRMVLGKQSEMAPDDYPLRVSTPRSNAHQPNDVFVDFLEDRNVNHHCTERVTSDIKNTHFSVGDSGFDSIHQPLEFNTPNSYANLPAKNNWAPLDSLPAGNLTCPPIKSPLLKYEAVENLAFNVNSQSEVPDKLNESSEMELETYQSSPTSRYNRKRIRDSQEHKPELNTTAGKTQSDIPNREDVMSLEDVIDGLLALSDSCSLTKPKEQNIATPESPKSRVFRLMRDATRSNVQNENVQYNDWNSCVNEPESPDRLKDILEYTAEYNIVVKCRNPVCGKSTDLQEARKSFKTCHNCYTYYCSRNCRKAHWERHKQNCLYSRVNSSCKHLIKKIHDESALGAEFSRIARTGYLQNGRGCVLIVFSSLEKAEKFFKSGLNGLESSPAYVCLKDLKDADAFGDQLHELTEMCKTYNPEVKFVVDVVIITGDSNTVASGPRRHGPAIKKCAKLRLVQPHSPTHHPASYQQPETLILTAVPGSEFTENMEERKAREVCFVNIQRKLRQRGVSLRHHFPEVYNRLCAYVADNEHFSPITLFPMDVNTGKRFMCLIMPHSEPDIEWMYKPDLLEELGLSTEV